MTKFYEDGFDPDDIDMKVSELLVATADGSDELIDGAVTEVLGLLRERLHMDVVFVSEFVAGQRVFRYVDNPPDRELLQVGDSGPLEESWCQRVVDGRMPELIPDYSKLPQSVREEAPRPPFDIGTHISTPIVLDSGQVYGTLCAFSFSPYENVQQRDLKNLKSVAMLVAKKVGRPREPAKSVVVDPGGLQLLQAGKW